MFFLFTEKESEDSWGARREMANNPMEKLSQPKSEGG